MLPGALFNLTMDDDSTAQLQYHLSWAYCSSALERVKLVLYADSASMPTTTNQPAVKFDGAVMKN